MAAMTVTTPTNVEVPVYPTWMNTLNGQPEWFSHHPHAWLGPAEDAAWAIGYYFLLWNGRVYFINTNDEGRVYGRDTGWLREDIDHFTAHHPDVNRHAEFSDPVW